MLAARRAAPASPYKRQRSIGAFIFNSERSCGFPSGKRLVQAEVLAVLKRGKRVQQTDFELRFLIPPATDSSGYSKIAISVPKRLLKSSVARNRIKRLVREAFRGHRAISPPLHLLVNYKARSDGRDAAARRNLRIELLRLFDDAFFRSQSGRIGSGAV